MAEITSSCWIFRGGNLLPRGNTAGRRWGPWKLPLGKDLGMEELNGEVRDSKFRLIGILVVMDTCVWIDSWQSCTIIELRILNSFYLNEP